jgi:hypothetical protein
VLVELKFLACRAVTEHLHSVLYWLKPCSNAPTRYCPALLVIKKIASTPCNPLRASNLCLSIVTPRAHKLVCHRVKSTEDELGLASHTILQPARIVMSTERVSSPYINRQWYYFCRFHLGIKISLFYAKGPNLIFASDALRLRIRAFFDWSLTLICGVY